MPKLTIHDLIQAQKSGHQYTEVRIDRLDEARAAGEAGIEIIMCMHENVRAFREVAPDAFIITADELDQPHISTPDQCVAAGFACMNAGADAVYTGMSLWCVEAMARESIPTIGHVGFVPYRATWIGGPRAIGKKAPEAAEVYRKCLDYENAGALGVEMEIVPARVLEAISQRTNLILMSMGSASGGMAQYLLATDELGTTTGHIPRHAKVYADLHTAEEKLHQMRVEAFKQLKQEVNGKLYPEDKHTLKIKDEEFAAFVAEIDKG